MSFVEYMELVYIFRRQMKAQMHIHGESPSNTLEWIGIEALLSGQAITHSQIESAIDKLTLDDVTRVSRRNDN